jgi:hypothetical protein
MLLTESIEKASDAGVEWKDAVFFYAEASSMEVGEVHTVLRSLHENRRFNQ